MVSGLVTSPLLHARMRSGEASVRRRPFQVSRGGSLRGVNAIVVREIYKLRLRFRRKVQGLDIERKTADLVGKDGEGCRRARVTDRFALHDRIEGSGTALDVV